VKKQLVRLIYRLSLVSFLTKLSIAIPAFSAPFPP